jgi:hypothetical protein
MKKIIFILLLCVLPLKAESENELLFSVLVESATTVSQKTIMSNYFKSLISKKENEVRKLEDKILLSYGGKYQRDKIIKQNIKNEIIILEKEIESYKYTSNQLGK